MGNYTSKLFSYNNNEHETRTEKMRVGGTPLVPRKLTDPRSATIGITRTPIQVNLTPLAKNHRIISAVPRYLREKRYLETDLDAIMSVDIPKKCLPDPRSPNISQMRTPILVKSESNDRRSPVSLNEASSEFAKETKQSVGMLDPRSPATDFDRTPILKSRCPEQVSTVDSKGEKAESSCRDEMTANDNVPEMQRVCESFLESYSSDAGLNNSLESLNRSDTEEQITVIRNRKISSFDSLSVWTVDENVQKDDEDRNENADVIEKQENGIDESTDKTLDEDTSETITTTSVVKKRSSNDKIKVWRDSVSPRTNDEYKSRMKKSEVMIDFDESIPSNARSINVPKAANSIIDDEKAKNLKRNKKPVNQPKDENKPLAEARRFHNIDTKNRLEPSVCRTPLANRSNNQKHGGPSSTKSPQHLLRNKGLSAKLLQQENTPPPAERIRPKSKPHGIQWDPDTTVII